MSVEQPNVIDLVAHDPTGEVILVMVESREWDGSDERLFELRVKINNYTAFALDGELTETYPEFVGKPVRLELRCVDEPDTATADFLAMAIDKLRAIGLPMLVKKIGQMPSA